MSGKTSLTSNDTKVRLLRNFMANGLRSADAVPNLVKDVCDNDRFMERIDEQTGQRWAFKSFDDFVGAAPLAGLGSSVEVLRNLCRDDIEALAAIDRATQRGPGGANNPEGIGGKSRKEAGQIVNVYNVNIDNLSRPVGNSRQQALRKLRTEAEKSAEVKAIYDRVVKEEISPHRGMIEAGFRKVKTPGEQIQSLWGKLTKAERRKLLSWLQKQE